MIVYAYRCPTCGPFDVRRPLGSAGEVEPCPGCDGPGRRVFTAPALARTPTAATSARARAEASAYEPEVVGQPPPRRTPPRRAAHPAQARLPRP